jgi:hypothetical protein
MLSRRYALCFLAIIAAFVLACSSGSKSPAPTAPTAVASSSTATIDLTVTTATGTPGAGFTAPVVGIVSGLTGTCPEVTFVLSGVTIHVTGATKFESGTCADVQNGVRAGAIGTKNANGVIEAVRVKVGVSSPTPTPPKPPTPPSPPPHAEGVVTGLSGPCPTLRFTLSGTTVITNASTRFQGGGCTDVKEGVRAGASGPKDANGAITAEHVKIIPPPPTPPPHASGPVIGLSGSCPTLTFTLSGTTVRASSTTVFEGGACTDVKEGARAAAMGPKDASGVINAVRVKIGPPPMPGVAGTVTSVSGTCPAVTFVVTARVTTGAAANTTTVRTSDKTRFEGGSCADIKAGVRVGVMGPKASDGSIDAQVAKIGPK